MTHAGSVRDFRSQVRQSIIKATSTITDHEILRTIMMPRRVSIMSAVEVFCIRPRVFGTDERANPTRMQSVKAIDGDLDEESSLGRMLAESAI